MSRVTIMYFSPTGNTRKSLEAMAAALGGPAEAVDLTAAQAVPARSFGRDDIVIIGMPVYAGRVPAVARERFAGFRGDGTSCLVVVTYGNRHYDDALLELSRMAEEQGFAVKGAAALVGRHTFGSIQMERPDREDLAAAGSFAVRALAKTGDSPVVAIPGNTPYRDGGQGGKFRPQTSDACVRCGLCVEECPVHAIAEDCRTIADTCLSCFRCIRNCPVEAKNMDTEAYNAFASAFTEKLRERRENEYYL